MNNSVSINNVLVKMEEELRNMVTSIPDVKKSISIVEDKVKGMKDIDALKDIDRIAGELARDHGVALPDNAVLITEAMDMCVSIGLMIVMKKKISIMKFIEIITDFHALAKVLEIKYKDNDEVVKPSKQLYEIISISLMSIMVGNAMENKKKREGEIS